MGTISQWQLNTMLQPAFPKRTDHSLVEVGVLGEADEVANRLSGSGGRPYGKSVCVYLVLARRADSNRFLSVDETARRV